MSALAITGPADIRDQQWLDGRIAAASDGIEAVIEIAENWTDGRNVSRLHPGVAAADYVREHIGIVAKAAIVPLLERSNWSNRQIAAVAGVSHQTVARTGPSGPVDRPAETLGADGKLRLRPRPRLDPEPYAYAPRTVTAVVIDRPQEEPPIDDEPWRALAALLEQIETLAERDATDIAATVPSRRRPATARRLRKLGTFLGRIAWTLEGKVED